MSGGFMALGLSALVVLLYAVRLNWMLFSTPKEAAELSGGVVTKEEIREVLKRIRKNGIDWVSKLPVRKERRYIVVGGSGLLGGQIILDLLARGTPPEAIRILDARRPTRDEFAHGPAAKVAFIQTDITNEATTLKGYSEAWPASVAKLPLTVFHTAAVIRPFERLGMFYDRTSRVNVTGVVHSLTAAKKAGAGLFVATSSCNAGLIDVNWMPAPWAKYPKGYMQIFSEKDFFEPLRPPSAYPTLYARSKAEVERIVCGADEQGGMRTGVVRPGNAIYGHKDDNMIGKQLEMRRIPTWVSTSVQNFMNVRNASLGHLQHEDAMLGEHADKIAARPYLITDGGKPIIFQTMYNIMGEASTGFKVDYPPPVLILLFCFMLEWYTVLVKTVPFLDKVLSEPGEPLRWMQPGVYATSLTAILDDSDARRKPKDGGIGYTPCCTAVEGMCQQVVDWDEWVAKQGKK